MMMKRSLGWLVVLSLLGPGPAFTLAAAGTASPSSGPDQAGTPFLERVSNKLFRGPVEIGGKTGFSIADFYGGSSDSWDSRTGWVLGGFLRKKLSPYFTLQPEILYLQKGASYSEDYLGRKLSIDIKAAYLEFPLLVKFHPLRNVKLQPSLLAGPSLSFKINDDIKARYDGHSTSVDEEDLESFNFGFILGLDVTYPLKSGCLVAEIRYDWGLTDAFSSGGGVKNRVLTIMAGYIFNLN